MVYKSAVKITITSKWYRACTKIGYMDCHYENQLLLIIINDEKIIATKHCDCD